MVELGGHCESLVIKELGQLCGVLKGSSSDFPSPTLTCLSLADFWPFNLLATN